MKNNKENHVFDLDGTLLNTNAMYQVIDKNNPDACLFKLSPFEAYQIFNGFYKKEGYNVYYNGQEGWLSQEIFKKIKRNNIKLENVGISFREYFQTDLIQEQAKSLIVYLNRLKGLENKNIDVLTARGNKHGHNVILEKLNIELNSLNIKVNNAVFVNDVKNYINGQNTSEKKLTYIIEKLVGYTIKKNVFMPILTEGFNTIYFYEDEDRNLEICEQINMYISKYLERTVPWLKQEIEEKLSVFEHKLVLNKVSTNELNPFETKEILVKI